MASQPVKFKPVEPAEATGFIDLFNEMSKLGSFDVNRMGDGCWHGHLKLPTPDGVTVEVRSGFGHPTAYSALVQLSVRVADLRERLAVGAAIR